jgi:phosphorylase kinase alpha/beta subunit
MAVNASSATDIKLFWRITPVCITSRASLRFSSTSSVSGLFFSHTFFWMPIIERRVNSQADYRRRLEGLEQRNNGVGLLPELYYVPASSIEAEKANPGSQKRLPNENVPLVWAQSLWWLAQMLDDGLLDRNEVDPLGRHRRRPKPVPPVQIALLAEDLETQTQLANLGIRTERVDELETIELRPARELARFYSAQGACPVLGLTGRPERRLRTLTTARFYRLGERRLAFAPSVVADHQDHLGLDMAILCQRLRSEVAYLFPPLAKPGISHARRALGPAASRGRNRSFGHPLARMARRPLRTNSGAPGCTGAIYGVG